MKYKSFILGAVLSLCAFVSMPVSAQLLSYSGGCGDGNATNSCTIISANGKLGTPGVGQPLVTYINVTSDKSTSKLNWYSVGAPVACTGPNSTTRIDVANTNTFVAGDVVIIQHVAGDTYERRVITASTGATNLVTWWAPATACAAGDLVYRCTKIGNGIPVGATNFIWAGTGLIAGQAGAPLLIDLDGTSAVSINCITARYER
jgi:hypothetical protein